MGKIIKITRKQLNEAAPSVSKALLVEGGRKRYYVNLDIKPAKQGRTAVKINVKDFEQKMRNIWEKYPEGYSDRFSPSSFVYRFCRPYKKDVHELDTLHQDLKKVKFDYENCDMIGDIRDYNGASYIIAQAGGDWECPVLFFVYWDGSKFRGYVPIYGNAVNRKTNSAFQQGDEDKEFLKTQGVPDDELSEASGNVQFNKDACIKDFKSRVKVK